MLKRVKGQPHLPQIVETFHDTILEKFYIVQEHAGGLTLKELMKAHPNGLAPVVAKDLTRQLLEAVFKIHLAGICHRDLKPDNVLLRRDPLTKSGFHLTVIDLNVAVDLNESPVISGGTGLKKWSAPETR